MQAEQPVRSPFRPAAPDRFLARYGREARHRSRFVLILVGHVYIISLYIYTGLYNA